VTLRQGAEHLRVLDFGLAKIDRPELVSAMPVSTHEPFVGTLAYAAPEQITERPVDTRTDLYSVGMILYYLLARRLPFIGSDYRVARAIVEEAALLVERPCADAASASTSLRVPSNSPRFPVQTP